MKDFDLRWLKRSVCRIFVLSLFFLCACKFIYAQHDDSGSAMEQLLDGQNQSDEENVTEENKTEDIYSKYHRKNETKSVGYDWEYEANASKFNATETNETNVTSTDLYGKDYSSRYINNPYAKSSLPKAPESKAPKTYTQQVKDVSAGYANPYDSQVSAGTPYGKYGNMYSPDKMYNPMSQYQSPYNSTANPYISQVPLVYGNTTLDKG